MYSTDVCQCYSLTSNCIFITIVFGCYTSSVSEILDAIHGYVRSKRNVTLDRVALEERRQEEGETFDEYYIALREIANNADLCKVCVDDRPSTRIMSGIREPETKRKLLAHTHPPSLQTTLNICRSEESAHNDELTLANSEHVSTKIEKIHKHRQYQPGKPRFQNNTSPKGNQCCGYCGKMRHESRDQCPAKQSECTNCKKNWGTGQHAVVKNNESIQHIEHPR